MYRRVLLLALLFAAPIARFSDDPGEGYLPEPLELLDKIPVADSAFLRHRGLPASVDLSRDFPQPGNQGKQGSCVGFATTYAVKTYYEKRKRQWDLSSYDHIFSPAWTYNQINKGRDRGAHIPHALELLITKGAVPWSMMPYDPSDYRTQPGAQHYSAALQYRAKSYEQLPPYDIEAMKAELAHGNPIIVGVYTGPDRRNCCRNGEVLDQFTQKRQMGHAMVVVGYDDRKISPRGHRGAFKLMDSGGTQVATGGFAWVSYQFVPQFFYAAYLLREDSAPIVSQSKETQLQPPTKLRATKGAYSNKVALTWQKANGANAYEIERSIADDANFISIGFSGDNSFEDTAVQEDVAYDYRVISIRDSIKSDPGQSMIVRGFATTQKTAEPPLPVVTPGTALRPAQVESLSATRGTYRDKIVLTWDTVIGAEKYWLVRFDQNSGTWRELAWTTANRYEDKSPEAITGIEQAYSVRAANAKELGDAATPAWGYANPYAHRATAMPDRPIDLKVELKHKRVLLTWKAVAQADEYYIFCKRFRSSTWSHIATSKTPRFSEKFPGNAGELWYYTVRTRSAASGESEPSAIAATVLPAERVFTRTRFDSSAELQVFFGKWMGEASIDKKMQHFALEISGSGENFTVVMIADQRGQKVSGKYVARSHELSTGGVMIRRIAANSDMLAITCRDRVLCGAPFRGIVQRAQ